MDLADDALGEEEEALLPSSASRGEARDKLARFALNGGHYRVLSGRLRVTDIPFIVVNFAINMILLVSKGLAVLSSSSISLVASFVDSALDFLSTLIILGTSLAMGVPSDRHTFPAGKRRFEPLGVLVFSVAMIASFAQVRVHRLGGMRLFLMADTTRGGGLLQVFIESFQRATGKQADEVAQLSWIGIA
jgi:hypothetical protein